MFKRAPDKYSALYPERLMRTSEKKLLAALVRSEEHLSGVRLDDGEAWDRRVGIGASMADLAAKVLKRELSLSPFMVLDIRDPSGFGGRLQVLEMGVSTWRGMPPRWRISGRALRKDGTLGAKPETVVFDHAIVLRRTLHGEWVRLRELVRCRGRNDHYRW